MPGFFRRFLTQFKEYIVLTIILIISLILISQNNNPKIKNIRLYALSSFAIMNYSLTGIIDYFQNTSYTNDLERINAELMLQVNLLREYGLENNELKNYLKYSDNSEYELIVSRIVSRVLSKINGNFIISKGSKDSIKVGMPVISHLGLIGLVVDVTDNFSTVRTYENSKFKVAVKNQRSNVSGIINWNGKNLIIKNVPTTYDIEIGDRIVVSELSSIILPSIPIGIVAEKEATLSGILTNIIVKPFVDINSIKNVLVIKSVVSKQLDDLELNLIGEK